LVKAPNGNYGKELADQLAQDAASTDKVETTYSKILKSAVARALEE
jgi:hypothetical protein